MQSHYPAQFAREMGCTADEFVKWLHAALTDFVWQCETSQAHVTISNDEKSEGVLCLRWQVLPERRIALLRLPRLQVSYQFDGVADEVRTRFMQRLDLFMQRGGG